MTADADRLAAKLRPLMPEAVDRWLRGRAMSDPETARLIDEQIRAAAMRVLGGGLGLDALLSLPPAGAIAGPVRLGTVQYAGDRGEAGLRFSEVLQNVAILGRSGSGKTNAAFNLLIELDRRGVPFLFLDFKRTARHLIPHLKHAVGLYTPGRSLAPLEFNPFTPPPSLEPIVYAGHALDALAGAYQLGAGSMSLLARALENRYASGDLTTAPADILNDLLALDATGRRAGWVTSAARALESLVAAGLGGGGRTTQRDLSRRMLGQSTILELDGLPLAARKFLATCLCLWVYFERMADPVRERLSLVIVVEEGHTLLHRDPKRGRESAMEMLLRQCREIGIGMVVIAQHPALVSSAVLGNTCVTLLLNLKDPTDINKAAGLAGVDDRDKTCFTHLPVGHAVVKLQERWRDAFVVRLPQAPVVKGSVTDDALPSLVANFSRQPPHSPVSTPHTAASGHSDHIRDAEEPLTEDDLRLLEDVLAHPHDGVRARYLRIGFSGERGNTAKTRLITGGWLEAQRVAVGVTRVLLLRLTARARDMLGLHHVDVRRESLAHAYWKHRYATMLRGRGFDVAVEAARGDGFADVLAAKDGRRLAVEVETGMSDAVANVRAGLLAGCDVIIVSATTARALETVERQLAVAGLLLPGRVLVVLQDQFDSTTPW